MSKDRAALYRGYVFVAWHLHGLSLEDWFKLDDEGRKLLTEEVTRRVQLHNEDIKSRP